MKAAPHILNRLPINRLPVIIDHGRTPMGRSKGGAFRNIRAEELSAHLMMSILKRHPQIDPSTIDDIIWGCVQQTLEQAFNVARNAQLMTEIPRSVPAQTVNRLCGSSMTALHMAAQGIMANQGDIYLCGGVEHMGHVPMIHGVDFNPLGMQHYAKAGLNMGLTAEYLALRHQISRQDQDQFSLRSHQKAWHATGNGKFRKEIIPTMGHDAQGIPQLIVDDEVIRPDTSLEGLSQLKPVFNPSSGTVTAGNSSAISDGASILLVMSYEKALSLGYKPRYAVTGTVAVGCDPSIMGYGPVPAVKKLMQQTQRQLKEVELFELNEAFAAQSLAVIKDLDLLSVMEEKINVNGGAIALGHPLGCSGARIIGTLLTEMNASNKRVGVATMCIGLGQGVATLIEEL